MNFQQKDYTNLENALRKAYRGKAKPQVSEQWEMSVMQHIRSLGALPFKTSPLELFEQFGWRFAPAACIVIALLTFWMVKLDFVSEDEMAKISIEQPIEASYVEMPGL
ncbi:MAG: hypothetical protein OS130_05775 [Thermodesulfobacteriota bacterium]|jgi:uncharacterized membrane protein YeiB|nr:MAG: hypothetical protein OS130_05775 [Thermodesulfobacteriota bacterium]